jgi:glycosyltransferase involved in cell wall biosynthesis
VEINKAGLMQTTELFTIIVANYNNGRYLPQLFESMFAQTYPNWELVIADDRSTDNSVEVIEPYLKKDGRIKLVKHLVNKGAGAAFKTAMDHSAGSIIGMLGADDALLPEALSIMLEAHKEFPKASMINSKAYDCDAELNPVGLCSISGEQPQGVSFIHEIFVGNFVTYKRSAYDRTNGFDPDYQRAVDRDIFLKLEEVGELAFVDQALYLYRRHDLGISQGGNGMKAANFELRARMDAYERRRHSGFSSNLSQKEYEKIALMYYSRKSFNLRSERKAWEALKANFHCLQISSGYIFKRNFWSSLFYSTKALLIK